jgi:hypothetical protein
MRRFVTALFVLFAFPAAAAEVPAVDGWILTSGFHGGMQDSYDHTERHRAWSAKTTPPVLEAGAGATPGMRGAQAIYLRGNAFLQTGSGTPLLSFTRYGALEKRIAMEAWRGKRVRLSLRTRDDGARAWIASQWGNRINPVMMNGTGTAKAGGWRTHQLVFDVPARAGTLTIAMGIIGEGAAWLDDLRIEAVGADVPLPRACSRGGLCWESAADTPSWRSAI